jgi:hypothetical protein
MPVINCVILTLDKVGLKLPQSFTRVIYHGTFIPLAPDIKKTPIKTLQPVCAMTSFKDRPIET